MMEAMERVIAIRIVVGFALGEYLRACYALQASDMVGVSSSQLLAFTSSELSHFTSHEDNLFQAKALLGNSRNLSGAARALPVEILSRIFHFASQNDNYINSTFLTPSFPKQAECLSHVCSLWRRVAPGTRSLWSHITVAPRHPANARLLARAKLYVTRAGGLPLHIHITKCSTVPHLILLEEENLLEFLNSISPRICSLELSAPLRNTEYYTEYLQVCLAGAIPGTLTRLEIDNKGDSWSRLCPRIESSHDFPGSHDISLDIPAQTLENILASVAELSLGNTYISWTSKAYHGLVELRLCCPVTKELSIPESDLYGILSASPGLRVIVFELPISDEHWNDSLVAPIALKHLNTLDISKLQYKYLSVMLRMLAPSRLSRLSINLGGSGGLQVAFDQCVEQFIRHSCISQLAITSIGSLRQLRDIYHFTPHLDTLALSHSNLAAALDGPVAQPKETHESPCRLYISNSSISIPNLCRIVEEYDISALTLWRCDIFFSRRTPNHASHACIRGMLSPKYSNINVLDRDEPNPLRELGLAP